jgi:hypothetical protein
LQRVGDQRDAAELDEDEHDVERVRRKEAEHAVIQHPQRGHKSERDEESDDAGTSRPARNERLNPKTTSVERFEAPGKVRGAFGVVG